MTQDRSKNAKWCHTLFSHTPSSHTLLSLRGEKRRGNLTPHLNRIAVSLCSPQ
jgi:hypothetical protein